MSEMSHCLGLQLRLKSSQICPDLEESYSLSCNKTKSRKDGCRKALYPHYITPVWKVQMHVGIAQGPGIVGGHPDREIVLGKSAELKFSLSTALMLAF